MGVSRDDALQDALRNAVGQALGTYVQSETRVENFKLLKDVIQTRTRGYVSQYKITSETQTKEGYEVVIDAWVSLNPLKQDAKTLAQWIGGVRFMTFYDPRNLSGFYKTYYDYAYERMNEWLARHDWRYVEKMRFEKLLEEAVKIGADKGLKSLSYAQKLAFYADAPFLIFIKNIDIRKENKAFGTVACKVRIEIKSYDNCTAEGLGTIVAESDWQISKSENESIKKAIDMAMKIAGDKLFYLVTKYIASWARQGAPFELRFYKIDEDKMDELVDKLNEDPDFGGQLEPVITQDYWRLNCTFKSTPYRLRRKIRKYGKQIGLSLETILQYVRQLSFGPKGYITQEAKEKQKIEQGLR